MNRWIGLGMIVAGAIVGWFGWQEYQSVGSKLTEAVSGSPTDNAIWMLVIGAVLVVVGLGMTYRSFR